MYVHPSFEMSRAEALSFLRDRGFGTLVVTTSGGPSAVHVPLIALEEEGRLHLEFHVARANPIHTQIGEGCRALFVCQGPDAYISPDWYGVTDQVPTWTYVAVHLSGTVRTLAQDEFLDHVDRLSAAFEQRLLPKPPWTTSKMPEKKRDAMLRAIVALRFDVETIEAQTKVSQQKSEAARAGAVDGLRLRGDPGSLAIADLMEKTLKSS